MSRLLCKCASDIHAEQFYWRKQGENVFIKLRFTKRGFYVSNVFLILLKFHFHQNVFMTIFHPVSLTLTAKLMLLLLSF